MPSLHLYIPILCKRYPKLHTVSLNLKFAYSSNQRLISIAELLFSFANTGFEIAATSSFSYQKEAEGFQMAQLQNTQLGVVQSRPFGGNKGCSFPVFLICLSVVGFNQGGFSDLVHSLAYKHLWQHN